MAEPRRAPAGYPADIPKESREQDTRLTELVEAIAKLKGLEVLPKDTRDQKLQKIHDSLMKEFGLNPKLVSVKVTPSQKYDSLYEASEPGSTYGRTQYKGNEPGPLTRIESAVRDYTEPSKQNTDFEAYRALAATMAHELMHAKDMASTTKRTYWENADKNPTHFSRQGGVDPWMDFGVQQQEYQNVADQWLESELAQRVKRLKRSTKEQDIIDLMGDVVDDR